MVECSNCGIEFRKRPGAVKKNINHFCTVKCMHDWRTGRKGCIKKPKGQNKNCEWCKKQFYVYPSEINTKKFCSRTCKGLKFRMSRTVDKRK